VWLIEKGYEHEFTQRHSVVEEKQGSDEPPEDHLGAEAHL
jgi:hypothetical protein